MKNFILAIILMGLISNVAFKTKKHTLKGFVHDYTGNPVENVVVSVDHTGLFAITNGKGYYKIKSVPESCLTLRFNHENYEPSSATIGIYNSIDLTLFDRGDTERTEYSIEDVMNMKISIDRKLAYH